MPIIKDNVKWIALGGYVGSSNDEERHYISANAVCKMYGVNANQCFLVENRHNIPIERITKGLPDLPILYPDKTGVFKLPPGTKSC